MADRRRGRPLVLLGLGVAAALPPGCGHASVRRTQEWEGVSDPRLFRAVHVTNHGTGVCIARTDDALFVLANAHVVGGADEVTVYRPNPATGAYDALTAAVVRRSHPTKVDLALLRIDDPPPGEEFRLVLAAPMTPGERRPRVDLMAVTAPDRPFVYSGPIVERTVLWAGKPDDWGSPTYERSMACVFGGVLQANSGSPVFEGDRLIGIHEISPFSAPSPADEGDEGDEVTGIGVSTPTRLREFLTRCGYGYLLATAPED